MARKKQLAIANANFLQSISLSQRNDASGAPENSNSSVPSSSTHRPGRIEQGRLSNVEFLESIPAIASQSRDLLPNNDSIAREESSFDDVIESSNHDESWSEFPTVGGHFRHANIGSLQSLELMSPELESSLELPTFDMDVSAPQPDPLRIAQPETAKEYSKLKPISDVGFLEGLAPRKDLPAPPTQCPSSNTNFMHNLGPHLLSQQSPSNVEFLQKASYPQSQPQSFQANNQFLQRIPRMMAQQQMPQSNMGFLVGRRNSRQSSMRGKPSTQNPTFVGENQSPEISSSQLPRKRAKVAVESGVSLENSTFKGEVNSETFRYPHLDGPASESTRLMVVDQMKSREMGAIHCILLSCQPWKMSLGYKCLSYVWGDATTTRKIFIKSSHLPDAKYYPFHVTINLEAALRRLLSANDPDWFWIDAICINQTDLEERASQVSMMKHIYNNATGVVIWLGESTSMLSDAISTVRAISAQFTVDTAQPAHSITGPDGLRLRAEDVERLKSYFSTKDPHPVKSSIELYNLVSHFFSLTWFRRVWVLQEAFSHASITVHLGQHVLSWGNIILAALWQACFTRDNTVKSANTFDTTNEARGFLPELWLGLLHTKTQRGLSMVELVCRARDFEASDSRDKIFAMLGLANDLGDVNSNPAGLRPNYTKSKAEVYCDFAKDLISHTGELDILSAVNAFHPRESNDFPSWMPDLDAPISTIRGLGFPRKYNAAFSTQATCSHIDRQSLTNPTLSLSGFVIGTIHTMTSSILTFRRDLRLYLGPADVDAIHALWTEYIQPLCQRTTVQQVLSAYVNMLAAAGFALPTEFPAHPLGKVVPAREVPSLIADFAAYWSRSDPKFTGIQNAESLHLDQLARIGDPEQFGVVAGKGCHERKLFISGAKTMGLCPWGAEIGDKIVILYGGSVPYVLRNLEDGAWRFVGEAYVDGWMFGEARDRKVVDGIEDQVFVVQ